MERRQKLTAAFAALALTTAACSTSTDATQGSAVIQEVPVTNGVDSGPTVPDVAFGTFDGAEATLADFAGRPVVVNFWASWCPSCVAEMSAAFRPVAQDLGDRVVFIGMNIQDERSAAIELLEETGVKWLNAEDPRGQLYLELGGLGMPYTVYVSEDGRVVGDHNGPLNEALLRQQIEENLLG